MANVSFQYKDCVFRFLFGHPENKAWTLSLYNAVNDSAYENSEEIQFNALENVVYMGMRNAGIYFDSLHHQLRRGVDEQTLIIKYSICPIEKITAHNNYLLAFVVLCANVSL